MRCATRTVLALLSAVLLLAAGLAAQKTDSAPALLRAATDKAVVDGDLNGAIKQYQTIIDTFKTDRAVVATALVRMADAYQKLGDAEPSRKIYERVVREFADQKEAAAEARARLGSDPTAQKPGVVTRQVWTGPEAFQPYSSPSPDGQYLSFPQQRAGGLAVRNLREGTSRPLFTDSTGSAVFSSSVFSPDGRQLAYEWGTSKDLKFDLRILPFTGGEAAQPRIVHRNEETARIRPYAWTPDGKQLLVLRSLKDATNQIAMVSVQDGSVRVLKSLAWQYARLSLSPDGRYLAYDAPSGDGDPTAPRDIFVLAADGSRETAVVQSPADDSSPLWSPDGSQIVFLSTRTGNTSLWRVPIEGGKPKGPAELVKADTGQIRLQGMTRSGSLYYLVQTVRRTNVYFAELDGTMKTAKAPVLATERFINSNLGPRWSPDGQYLAYVSRRGKGADGMDSAVLVIRTLETGEERDLSMPKGAGRDSSLMISPKWFPDGRSVLVKGFLGGKEDLFYRVDLASGHAELLPGAKGAGGGAGGLGANAISPDGKTIFYIAQEDAGSTATMRELVRFDIDSRRETVLKSGQLFFSLALSPDGTQLASARNEDQSQSFYLEVMPSGGGETREVFHAAGLLNPDALAWSPDQRYLLFVRRGNNESYVLWRVPVAGGEPEQIGISVTGRLVYPQVHPDGRRLTFALFETGASEIWALENFLPRARAVR
ncbi:MAG: PD40 domain-containing protein [Acidobacteria bacterium]|nr:PD40 domain-containing protein [Acidobacteriota bacterium]